MSFIFDYLGQHTVLTVFLCLGLGTLLGKVKIGSFRLGATVGTLLVGIVLSQLGTFAISGELKTVFFSLFIFTIGFEVGPAFFAVLRSSGLKVVAQSIVFTAIAVGLTWGACVIFRFDVGEAVGLFAGALTQTAVIGASGVADAQLADASLAYAITYIFGTIGVILFVKTIGPWILGQKLSDAVKEKLDKTGNIEVGPEDDGNNIQTRAFFIGTNARLIGKTVDEIETLFGDKVEVEAVYRQNAAQPLSESLVIEKDDVLLLIGDKEGMAAFSEYDETHITETGDPIFHNVKNRKADIVLTNNAGKAGARLLSEKGIFLCGAKANGKKIHDSEKIFLRGNVITVNGPSDAVEQAAKELGYIKNAGVATDIAFLCFAIAAGLFVGYLSVRLGNATLTLGEGGGAMLSGLLCGWWYNRDPRIGYIPASTRRFLTDIGLNLFIAVIGLSLRSGLIGSLLDSGWVLLLVGIPLTLLPHILTALFAKYILKMDTVDILGAQCGCGTVNAALNALKEETGTSVFVLSFAPGYAMGQVLLTLSGILIMLLI